jgi:peptidoglycan hydrolase-like protein with peptidoglycan-binding domain
VHTASPVTLPTLVRGAGIKPKPPSPNVKVLQQRLGIADDGQFGGGTEAAVIAYQRAHGLDPDGIVGPKTWASLFSVRT